MIVSMLRNPLNKFFFFQVYLGGRGGVTQWHLLTAHTHTHRVPVHWPTLQMPTAARAGTRLRDKTLELSKWCSGEWQTARLSCAMSHASQNPHKQEAKVRILSQKLNLHTSMCQGSILIIRINTCSLNILLGIKLLVKKKNHLYEIIFLYFEYIL